MKTSVQQSLDKLIVVGDRVLVKPATPHEKTQTGLFLPPGVQEKEKVQSGYIIKVGPGYPIPLPGEDADEVWKPKEEKIKYIPLQAREGDLAIYLQSSSFEISYNNEKYYIVPQAAILLLVRDEDLFN